MDADLDIAAAQAVTKIQELTEKLAEANPELDRAEKATAELQAQLATAMEDLGKAVAEVTAEIDEEMQAFGTEATDAKSAVTEAYNHLFANDRGLDQRRSNYAGLVLQSESTVTEAQERHREALGRARTAIEALDSRADALAAKLRELDAEVDDFIGKQLPDALDAVEKEVVAARARAEAAADAAVTALQQHGTAFASDVNALQEQIVSAFEDAPARVTEAVREATANYLEGQAALMGAIDQKAQEIEERMAEVQRTIAENDLDAVVQAAEADSRAVVAALRDIVDCYRAATEHCAEYDIKGAQTALAQLQHADAL